jgi:7-carboxy-7-deazaguanine synthase
MRVNEIFRSIEGEGKRAGLPCTFIRLFGCNIRCSYCDSQYACIGTDYTEMSIPQILEKVKSFEVTNVTVTGGEPLIHPGIEKLLNALLDEGYSVNVETNGTKEPLNLGRWEPVYGRNYKYMSDIFYTMDYKCPSSGMEHYMNKSIIDKLTKDDVLKFVVGSYEDLNAALEVIESIKSKPQIYFSPVFGKIEASDIVQYLIDKKLYDCKVQLQMHKYIWDPQERGV